MSNDELRKKCFELECALGKAIKIGEMQQEEIKKAMIVNGKLSRMDKRHLINALNTTSDILR